MTRRRSLLAAALAIALLGAGPALAGGPTEPPDGQFAGFAVRYRIPHFYISTGTDPGQCLWVGCWSASHQILYGIELWSSGSDPSRPPFRTLLGATEIDGGYLCQQNSFGPLVGRIVAPPLEKLHFECSAFIVSWPGQVPISPHPLLPASAKKRKR